MKKLLPALVALCLVTGFAVTTNAQKNGEPALVDIIPFGCSEDFIGLFADSLQVSWHWENGTTQTKFGGDVTYMVSGSVTGIDGVAVNFAEVIVNIEVEQYVSGTPADAYRGVLAYQCSTDQTAVMGTCNGTILGLDEALINALINELRVGEEELLSIEVSELVGVFVKAMNPGVEQTLAGNKIKSHTYPWVNVCDAYFVNMRNSPEWTISK